MYGTYNIRVDERGGIMKQIKVMYVFNFNSAFLGGAAQSLIDMLNGLSGRIKPVVVVREEAKIDRVLENMGVPCYKLRFSNDHVLIGHNTKEIEELDFFLNYEAAKQIAEIIKKENIDLMHINSSICKVGAIAALMAKIPYIWHVRELMEEQFGHEYINKELELKLFHMADRIITISEFVQNKYYEKYKLNSIKIYNGFDLERYTKQIKLGRKYRNIFLVAAMISPQKGQWDAMRATKLLVDKGHADIKLIIVGHGNENYVWTLKKYIVQNGLEENIIIIPYQNDLAKLREMASYSITCSQNEALGRVTVEAMLAGNVVIGAKSGGTAEIIGDDKKRGYLYEHGNYQNLAQVMCEIIHLPDDEKDKIAICAQKYAVKAFGIDRYGKEILDIYHDVGYRSYNDKGKELLEQLEKQFYMVQNIKQKEDKVDIKQYNKISAINDVLLRWIRIKQKGISIKQYFRDKSFRSIAIYGMGQLGCLLYDELEKSDIFVKYVMDRNPGLMGDILQFASVSDNIVADVIVVTVAEPRVIIEEMHTIGYRNVVSLIGILEELMKAENENLMK